MFLCSNVCNHGQPQPEITVNKMSLPSKILSTIATKFKRSQKNATVMIKKSKYNELLEQCRRKNTSFVDQQFLPNEKSLDYKVEGRQITWKRVSQIVKNCVMSENGTDASDIVQGNIGDCYFLSSIASLAEQQDRIQNIFHNNFQINGHGIYKLVVFIEGVPTQLVIDDYVPVFAETNRPVFCKPTRKEIWVMLIEKAWSKIKGSYGAISSGCPHEVLKAFSFAPCYYYHIQHEQDDQYKDFVWNELTDAADELMPIVAGTKTAVNVQGLLPSHAYTILDCENVKSHDKVYRIMRLRNPWGKTEYSGFASQNDKKFWDGVDPAFVEQFRPEVGSNSAAVNDGDFTMPFQEFMKSFQSIDICNSVFGYSYEFERIKMFKGQPLFFKFQIKEQHDAYLTVQRHYSQVKNPEGHQVNSTNYGHSRIVIAYQRDKQTYQYYDSKLQSDFPDITKFVTFKPGHYRMMVQTEDPRLLDQFEATFSYYYDTLEVPENKKFQVQYGRKYPNFLETVWLNHALRLNDDLTKIGPKPQDWVKTMFSYHKGGYGYTVCNLQHDTSIKMSISINKQQIKESGFYLYGNHPNEQILTAGCTKIFLFTCLFHNQNQKAVDIVFPPAGFKVSRIA